MSDAEPVRVDNYNGQYRVKVVTDDTWSHGESVVTSIRCTHVVVRWEGESVHLEITGIIKE